MPKHSNKKRNRNRTSKGAFTKAPMQGMGETYTWKTNDVQAVTFPASVGDNVYGLRLSADCNGFAWGVTQAGGNIVTSGQTAPYTQALYGENNSQFARIASLWEEFRVDKVTMEWQPVGMGGQVNFTTCVTVNDETGRLQGTSPITDVAEQISSQKNVHLHSPYMRTKRNMNYVKWLGQTQERAWLQTQQPDNSQIIREVYPTQITQVVPSGPTIGRTPALALVAGFNFSGSSVFSQNVTLGVVIFSCQFTFRQRRNLTSDPFLDQTLLYDDKEGCRHKRKVSKEEISTFIDLMDNDMIAHNRFTQPPRKDSLQDIDLSASLVERIKRELA